MLYEMIAVARSKNNITEVKDIARTAGTLILAHGGVVRGITNWGPFLLHKPIKKTQTTHSSGYHFIIRFDASPRVQRLVRKTIAVDPRMVRCGVVKMGETLRDVAGVEGKARWQWKPRDWARDLVGGNDSR